MSEQQPITNTLERNVTHSATHTHTHGRALKCENETERSDTTIRQIAGQIIHSEHEAQTKEI